VIRYVRVRDTYAVRVNGPENDHINMQQTEFTVTMTTELNVGDKVPDLTAHCVW
jgi:hypothetical protein